MDSASAQPVELGPPATAEGAAEPQISATLIDALWREAEADSLELGRTELAQKLLTVGAKYNYGLPQGASATPTQIEAFYRSLQLRELALAHACALGRDAAWQQFLQRFRAPLTQAAVAMTGSSSLGQDLADSLYSELFGLNERDGQRRSPLASYSGRGSLMGWLRTTLAQRHVDHHRRTRREAPLEDTDFAAAPTAPTPTSEMLARLGSSLAEALRALAPEDRFLLSAYFLDQRTLLQIAQLLRVHEATVSRKLKRLTSGLHQQLLKRLQASGMSRRAAEEALGTDPRDLTINLRNLLQTSVAPTFSNQTEGDKTKPSGKQQT
ncbi:sigma-70 family RNA polymerase sigma factor [Granulicella mallensis]|uniref:RNA polymerase sigma factor, sigma-70 family n=1 Tax=Granulicella mallensis (strain ATCC BAA-1857 / DSM 23137 / MP5ACTX8) TaxID=682795 RepID=G8P0M1_GRAMM|nr:sigma-70 family RNA polymerase sigma factor [Granulicella mallensis]AEU34629.1 RNA polymerase sigma factor, sigma-70 family [Granulicella mallensis MP5ACTX8]